jgi:lysozyme
MNNHITNISDKGLKLLMGFEGYSSKPYLDSAGITTISYGTIRYPNGTRVSMKDNNCTEAEGKAYLQHDLTNFESSVDALTVDTLNQDQFDALVLFAYNVGSNALKGSTLLKKVNKNPNDLSIQDEFTKWVYAGGKRIKGLLNRRNKESQLYFSKI